MYNKNNTIKYQIWERGIILKNTDIRSEVKAAGLYLWQIADALGINDGNFSRKLRHELPDEEKARIRAIIAALTAQKGAV